MENASEETF